MPVGYPSWTPKEAAAGKSPFNRPYQRKMLSCTSRRKVSRCIDASTRITLESGNSVRVEELLPGDKVISIDEDTFETKVSTVQEVIVTEIKSRFEIHTIQGHKVIVSDDHPFMTRDVAQQKWINLKQRTKKTRIGIANTSLIKEVPDNLEYTDARIKLLGYFLGGGYFGKGQTPKFINNSIQQLHEFEQCANEIGTQCKWYKKNDLILSNGRRSGRNGDNPVRNWLTELGYNGVLKRDRKLSDVVFSWSRRQVGLFLNRLWAADGWIATRKDRRTSVGIGSGSKRFLEGLQELLLKFSINSYVRPSKCKATNFFKLHISRSSEILKFFDLIGGEVFTKEKNTHKGKIIALASVVKDKVQSEKCVTWDWIKTVTSLPSAKMYDIVLDSVHTFIANSSMILHNCGRQIGKSDTLCVSILHKLFTNRGYAVTVITPYQSQIELLFGRIHELISGNTELINSIKEKRKSPYYYMELHNGSYIKAFSAGTKSHSEAGTVRGAHAHFLLFDEADMLSRGDLDASLALITNFPDAIVWLSSTPTGKRETFYNACFDPTYVDFSYPSSVNPMFTEELDQFFKRSLTESGYIHEVLADFGEDTQGVYQKKYIDYGKSSYNYGDLKPSAGWTYSFGVDWNDNAGSIIMVTGFNPGDNNYYLVDKQVVKKDGWTQTSAVQKIVQLNRYWNPAFIYVDVGYGSCVGPLTMIQTNLGAKPIKDIEVGDKVLTSKGLYQNVLGKVVAPQKESYSVRPLKCPKTTVSYCHPFLTYRTDNRFLDTEFNEEKLQWRTVKEIDINRDFIAIAKTQKKVNTCPDPVIDLVDFIDTTGLTWDDQHIWSTHSNRSNEPSFNGALAQKYNCSKIMLSRLKCQLKKGEFPSTELRRKLVSKIDKDIGLDVFLDTKVLKFNRYIDVTDKDFQLLLGWYLSEGNINVATVELGQKKLLNDFQRAIDGAAKLFPSSVVYERGLFTRLFVNGTIASRLFEVLGGRYSDGKRIHPFILDNFDCKYILQGIYLGDGHKVQDTDGWQLSLASSHLIYQLRQYFIDRDILPSLYFVKKQTENRKDQYRIDIGGDQETVNKLTEITGFAFSNKNRVNRRKYIVTPHYILVGIDKIEQIEDQSDLIDIQVENDNSFTGNGVLLHNTQVELLHGVGVQAIRNQSSKGPDARLATIVKAYNFGGTIEIPDLFTKQPIKKPAKPFLVENAVRFFEDGRIKYPAADEWLIRALEGYYIQRLTDSGVPKYSSLDPAIGDHFVDALNLSLLPFTLEMGEFGKPTFVANIAFTGYFGETKEEKGERERQISDISGQGEEQERSRRTQYLAGPSLFRFGLPLANTTFDKVGHTRVWSWPGFLRDEPPPKRKSKRYNVEKPRRKNI